jgi:hypothetical protein
MQDMWDLIDEFQCGKQLCVSAITTQVNLCKKSVNDNYQHCRENWNLWLVYVSVKMLLNYSKIKMTETQKCIHVNVSHVDLSDLLDWLKNNDESRYLSRVDRIVFCVTRHSESC